VSVVAIGLGCLAGVLSGLLGVGGGVLFVPALALVVGLGQDEAQATSLLAILPVALAGAWRQRSYGNLEIGDAALIGALATLGVVAGSLAANALDDRIQRIAFAVLTVVIAIQLLRRGIAGLRRDVGSSGATTAEREGASDGR